MSIRAWLQLFRAPNLFTVPGDPLAGFLIATGGTLDQRVWPAVASALCIYSAGLAMNDAADSNEDAAERPNRPIPSGAISRGAASGAALVLSLAGIGVLHATLGPRVVAMGMALLLTVFLYNFTTKKIPLLGPLTMGTCRAMSVMLGAVAGMGMDRRWAEVALLPLPDTMSWLAPLAVMTAESKGQWMMAAAIAGAFSTGIYIAAVTNLARHETRPEVPKLAKMLPLAACFGGYMILKLLFTGEILRDPSPTLWLLAVILCVIQTGELLKGKPRPLPPAIGGYIRLMLVMQASLCLLPTLEFGFPKTVASLVCAGTLLALVPISALVGKRFYAS